MNKLIVNIFIIGLVMLVAACSDKVTDVRATSDMKKSGSTMHSEGKAKEGVDKKGLAEAIKNKTLPAYPTMTIGKALDGYSFFNKREWRETFAPNGKIYIDFVGWYDTKVLDTQNIKNGISNKGLEIKFVINPDGAFFIGMISRVEVKTDGKIYAYPLPDIKAVMDGIYAGKEIPF